MAVADIMSLQPITTTAKTNYLDDTCNSQLLYQMVMPATTQHTAADSKVFSFVKDDVKQRSKIQLQKGD
jgi:hypothetical protein